MRFLITLVILACFTALVFGNFHWKQKIGNSTYVEATSNPQKNAGDEQNNDPAKKGEEIDRPLNEKLASLPEEVISYIEEADSQGKTIELLIIGSEVNTMGNNPWTEIFQLKMEEAYEELFHITVKEIPYGTSQQVVNEQLHMEDSGTPDLIILEPFLLNDNDVAYPFEQSLENVQTMIKDFRDLNPEVFVFLQPAHPLPGAVFYPQDMKKFQEFALEQGYPYIDHWTNWPLDNESEMAEHLLAGSIAPNELGHKLWSEYIVDLFISGKN
ncbi:SGNH/GDSL hydrolase family protein [Sutcliffiella deserti]|uniref:SGNH/GDSL hydrolase family protein n=1 Tax=Sutcliffiella deserti TaxID=2875501 RepID=UPI001CC145AA|nr:SGNH/GDSL hydrolase family protein [Sutcliffiella deserti]